MCREFVIDTPVVCRKMSESDSKTLSNSAGSRAHTQHSDSNTMSNNGGVSFDEDGDSKISSDPPVIVGKQYLVRRPDDTRRK